MDDANPMLLDVRSHALEVLIQEIDDAEYTIDEILNLAMRIRVDGTRFLTSKCGMPGLFSTS